MTKERALAKVFDKVPERRGGPPRPPLHQASGAKGNRAKVTLIT